MKTFAKKKKVKAFAKEEGKNELKAFARKEKKRGDEGLKHGSTAGGPEDRTGDGSTACRDATTPTDPGERFRSWCAAACDERGRVAIQGELLHANQSLPSHTPPEKCVGRRGAMARRDWVAASRVTRPAVTSCRARWKRVQQPSMTGTGWRPSSSSRLS